MKIDMITLVFLKQNILEYLFSNMSKNDDFQSGMKGHW